MSLSRMLPKTVLSTRYVSMPLPNGTICMANTDYRLLNLTHHSTMSSTQHLLSTSMSRTP